MKRLFLTLWIVLLMAGSGWGANPPTALLGYDAALPAAAGTKYYVISGSNSNGPETNSYACYGIAPCAGSLSDLYFTADGAPGAGTSWTLTVNGGAVTAQIADTATSATPDTTHSVSVAAGDAVYTRVVTSGTPTTNYAHWGCKFTPTDAGNVPLFSNVTLASNKTTYYVPPVGKTTSPNTYEAFSVSLPAGTVTAFHVKASAAPGASANRHFNIHVYNGSTWSDQGTQVDLGAADTAANQAQNITIADGDRISIKCWSDGTNNPAAANLAFGICFQPTDTTSSIIPTSATDGTNYIALQTQQSTAASTYAARQEPIPFNLTMKKIYVHRNIAPGAGKSATYTLYQNTTTATSLTQQLTTGNDASYASDVTFAAGDTAATQGVLSGVSASSCGTTYVTATTTVPTVTTTAPSYKGHTVCRAGGEVTSAGGGTLSASGVLFKAGGTPTISDYNVKVDTASPAVEAYAMQVSGLTQATTYTARAYATNEIGTGYGTGSDFTTLAAPYAGGNYYLDATGGDDANDGLAGTTGGGHGPWQTITKLNTVIASNGFAAGTNINFKRGETWRALGAPILLIDFTGAAGNRITFQDYGTGNLPKLIVSNKKLVTADWTDGGGGVYNYNVGSGTVVWVMENNQSLPPSATLLALTAGHYFWDDTGKVLYYMPTDGTLDTENVDYMLSGSANNGFFKLDSHYINQYITWKNLNFYGDGLNLDNTGYSSSPGLTITNCQFDDTYTTPLRLNACCGFNFNDLIITYNTFNYCLGPVVWLNNTISGSYKGYGNPSITYNTFNNCNYYHVGGTVATDGSADDDPIYLQCLYNGLVAYNTFTHCAAGKYAMINHWVDSPIVYNGNTVGASLIVKNNYLYDNVGQGIVTQGSADGATTIQIINNIINTWTAFGAVPGDGIRVVRSQSPASLIANNTLYNGVTGIETSTGADNFIIKNNIIHTMSAYYIGLNVAVGSSVIDYNCYYPGTGNTFYPNGGPAGDFAAWKTATSQDGHSITTDLAFVNAGGSYALATDFKTGSTSSARKAGLASLNSTVTTDYFSRTRIVWNDIGASQDTSSGGGGLSPGLGLSGGNYRPRQ